MVSKIAVMALVAVVAVPILLGYGLNFESEDREYYAPTGNSTDVTPLLSKGTAYNFVDASAYSLNSDANFYREVLGVKYRAVPQYNIKDVSYNTSLPMGTVYGWYTTLNEYVSIDRWNMVFITNTQPEPSTFTVDVHYILNGSETTSGNISNIKSFFYSKEYGSVFVVTGTGHYEFKNPVGVYISGDIVNGTIQEDDSIPSWTTGRYADPKGGWKFPAQPSTYYNRWYAPGNAESVLLTINLDSIDPAETSTVFYVHGTDGNNNKLFTFYRDGGSWGVRTNYVVGSSTALPHSDGISDNTYQVLMTRSGYEVRYIGSWPDTFGPAQYYWSKSFDWGAGAELSDDQFITYLGNTASGLNTQTTADIRIDAARVVATSYRLITYTSYAPDYLTGHTNPITTLTNAVKAGTSLTFAGHTYTVNGSSIMMGTHKVPIEGLELTSVPDGNGQYENAINGTVIGTTATPGAITFTGNWGVSVSTASQTSETIHVTKWVPGNFAWNGIDTNFKMAGILASFGAFVALAIYGRRSGARVLPLLLVCAGAGFMFLLMI